MAQLYRVLPGRHLRPRASTVTFTVPTEVTHASEHPDGSVSFQYADTGTYHVDFVDPALADQDSQFTETQHVTPAPGGTQVISTTARRPLGRRAGSSAD